MYPPGLPAQPKLKWFASSPQRFPSVRPFRVQYPPPLCRRSHSRSKHCEREKGKEGKVFVHPLLGFTVLSPEGKGSVSPLLRTRHSVETACRLSCAGLGLVAIAKLLTGARPSWFHRREGPSCELSVLSRGPASASSSSLLEVTYRDCRGS